MNIFGRIVFVFIILSMFSFANEKIKSGEVTLDELKNHIRYLSSNELKGRLTGSDGDSLAAEYIRGELIKSGLNPLYANGFQRFMVTDKIIAGPSNSLAIGGTLLNVNRDFEPLAFSQNGAIGGEVVFAGYGFDIKKDSLKWNDYRGVDVQGKIVMILRADPEIEKTMSPFIKYSRDRDKVLMAKDRGASAVLLVSGTAYDPEDKFEPLAMGEQSVGIPAMRITRKIANQLLGRKSVDIEGLEKNLNKLHIPASFSTGVSVTGQSDIVQTKVPTRNVVMVIPGSDNLLRNEYVILGAHFDHIGLGGVGSGSRVQDTIGVHHGADDNASGVAMVLELARQLAASPESHKRSILVIAFSGEEKGLLGSRHFVSNAEIDLNKVNAMINLDMVGRLNDNSKIQIGGVGTSDMLKNMIYTSCDTTVQKLSLSYEGYGPSDHAAFYGKNIPVLFVSSGAHLDYHTTDDTWEKINFDGMLRISDLAKRLILKLANTETKLAFKEAGPQIETGRGTRRKGISLGIMPDFAGNIQNGLRADLVTPGRPAAIGGMKKGDIIISINGKSVTNIQDYMFRLNQLKHGETINVEVLRDSQKVVLIIQL